MSEPPPASSSPAQPSRVQPSPAQPSRVQPSPAQPSREQISDANRTEANNAWSAFSLIASGVLVWGAVGWAVSHWLGQRWAIPVGITLGAGVALYAIWVRFGKAPAA